MTDAAWDVIVVGGGSAGAIMAARLSEDPARRVLLLEAGRDWRADEAPDEMRSANPLRIILPPALQHEWQYPGLMARRTRAQQPHLYWRGRGLGGSSVVNGQIAIRGVAAAFDEWAEMGCEGWSADAVLPFFRRFEADPDGTAGEHGLDGPMPVYRAPERAWGPVDQGVKEAALALGYPWNPDLNAPGAEGVACYPISSAGGRRVSTNEAYLEPARGRANLVIRGGALVDRVTFDGRRATGLRVRLGGEWQEMPAREVVLCAGACHSPAILMRSGVGDPAALARLGIVVVPCVAAGGAELAGPPDGEGHDHLAARTPAGGPGFPAYERLRQLQLQAARRKPDGHADDRREPPGVRRGRGDARRLGGRGLRRAVPWRFAPGVAAARGGSGAGGGHALG